MKAWRARLAAGDANGAVACREPKAGQVQGSSAEAMLGRRRCVCREAGPAARAQARTCSSRSCRSQAAAVTWSTSRRGRALYESHATTSGKRSTI